MNRKASFVSVVNLLSGLTDAELTALVDSPKRLKQLAVVLAEKNVQQTYFFSRPDKDVPSKFKALVVKWRKLASDYGYSGPIVWCVRKGFTILEHAPTVGECFRDFESLRDMVLLCGGEPTEDGIAFFIPEVFEESANKTVTEQTKFLAETRKKYGLPDHHLSDFGSLALLFGLVLAHKKRTGGNSSLDRYAARTGAIGDDKYRISMNIMGKTGLHCPVYPYARGRDPRSGVFFLGFEPDPSASYL